MKNFENLIFALAIVITIGGSAFAGNAFTPLNFEDATYTTVNSAPVIVAATEQNTSGTDLIGNTKM